MQAPVPPSPCPGRLRCGWSEHGRKHFPHRGVTPEHTVHGPARYLPGTTDAQIRAIETATAQAPTRTLAEPPGKAEYARNVDGVIGWDEGKDATISFVECSGGTVHGRAFHGRPLAPRNRKLR